MNLLNSKKIFKTKKIPELIDMCLFNEMDYMKLNIQEWLKDESNSLEDYRESILDIGSLCEGTVYLSDKTYRLAGFIIKRSQRVQEDVSIDYLFVPIYVEGNINLEIDPVIFQNVCNIYDDHGFISDSFGNCLYLDNIIATIDEIRKVISHKNIDLNKYTKINGIFQNI